MHNNGAVAGQGQVNTDLPLENVDISQVRVYITCTSYCVLPLSTTYLTQHAFKDRQSVSTRSGVGLIILWRNWRWVSNGSPHSWPRKWPWFTQRVVDSMSRVQKRSRKRSPAFNGMYSKLREKETNIFWRCNSKLNNGGITNIKAYIKLVITESSG